MNKKILIPGCIILLVVAFVLGEKLLIGDQIAAFSGATPKALVRNIPEGLSLKISGSVKEEFSITSSAFRLLAQTRIRTREVTPAGELVGAYIYNGVPVTHLLEGIAPKKGEDAPFDRPLDMIVTFISATGNHSSFSYGELTMCDDNNPVTLSYYREPLLPSKDPGKYHKNRDKGKVKGLILVCPGDRDTSRYLDDVSELRFWLPKTPDHLLPRQKKGVKCTSKGIICIQNNNKKAADYQDIETYKISGWFRIGHGRGIKGRKLNSASGYKLSSFLKKNFPSCSGKDFYLFVACDGYRVLFSGREIFQTVNGGQCILAETVNGRKPIAGSTLVAANDFFVDRNIRGISYVVCIKE